MQDGHPLLVKTYIYICQLHKFVYYRVQYAKHDNNMYVNMEANAQSPNIWMPYHDIRTKQDVRLHQTQYVNIFCISDAMSTSKVNSVWATMYKVHVYF